MPRADKSETIVVYTWRAKILLECIINVYDNRVRTRKEDFRVVEWVRALSLTPVAPVQIPVVCQSMIGVTYIQLTIRNYREAGIGLAYYLRTTIF